MVQPASVTEVTKEIKQGHEVYAICFQIKLEESMGTLPPDMQQLLSNYEALFREPTQLL